jgi:hypothetical protein
MEECADYSDYHRELNGKLQVQLTEALNEIKRLKSIIQSIKDYIGRL